MEDGSIKYFLKIVYILEMHLHCKVINYTGKQDIVNVSY